MRTLITGGTGYIGQRLAEALLERGDEVYCFGLPCETLTLRDASRVHWFHGDICDPHAVSAAMIGCDRVFHLAGYARNWARSADTFFRVNVLGTETVLACALKAGIKDVLHTSSNVVFGPSIESPIGENSPRALDYFTAYERSKEASERVARKYVGAGLRVVIVNPTRVFGPGTINEANSVTKMISQYLHGTWRTIPGNGNAHGNYVYVHDLVRGMISAMERGRSGENYILGGENLSYNEFFSAVADVTRCRRFLVHLPRPLAIGFASLSYALAIGFGAWPLITPGWMRTFLADWRNTCEKARRELGYSPIPFKTAVRLTVGWMVREGIVSLPEGRLHATPICGGAS